MAGIAEADVISSVASADTDDDSIPISLLMPLVALALNKADPDLHLQLHLRPNITSNSDDSKHFNADTRKNLEIFPNDSNYSYSYNANNRFVQGNVDQTFNSVINDSSSPLGPDSVSKNDPFQNALVSMLSFQKQLYSTQPNSRLSAVEVTEMLNRVKMSDSSPPSTSKQATSTEAATTALSIETAKSAIISTPPRAAPPASRIALPAGSSSLPLWSKMSASTQINTSTASTAYIASPMFETIGAPFLSEKDTNLSSKSSSDIFSAFRTFPSSSPPDTFFSPSATLINSDAGLGAKIQNRASKLNGLLPVVFSKNAFGDDEVAENSQNNEFRGESDEEDEHIYYTPTSTPSSRMIAAHGRFPTDRSLMKKISFSAVTLPSSPSLHHTLLKKPSKGLELKNSENELISPSKMDKNPSKKSLTLPTSISTFSLVSNISTAVNSSSSVSSSSLASLESSGRTTPDQTTRRMKNEKESDEDIFAESPASTMVLSSSGKGGFIKTKKLKHRRSQKSLPPSPAAAALLMAEDPPPGIADLDFSWEGNGMGECHIVSGVGMGSIVSDVDGFLVDNNGSVSQESIELHETINALRRALHETQRSLEYMTRANESRIMQLQEEVESLRLLRRGSVRPGSLDFNRSEEKSFRSRVDELEFLRDENSRLCKELGDARAHNSRLKAQLDRRVQAHEKLNEELNQKETMLRGMEYRIEVFEKEMSKNIQKSEEATSLVAAVSRLETDLAASAQVIVVLTDENRLLTVQNEKMHMQLKEIYDCAQVEEDEEHFAIVNSHYDGLDSSRSLHSELSMHDLSKSFRADKEILLPSLQRSATTRQNSTQTNPTNTSSTCTQHFLEEHTRSAFTEIEITRNSIETNTITTEICSKSTETPRIDTCHVSVGTPTINTTFATTQCKVSLSDCFVQVNPAELIPLWNNSTQTTSEFSISVGCSTRESESEFFKTTGVQTNPMPRTVDCGVDAGGAGIGSGVGMLTQTGDVQPLFQDMSDVLVFDVGRVSAMVNVACGLDFGQDHFERGVQTDVIVSLGKAFGVQVADFGCGTDLAGEAIVAMENTLEKSNKQCMVLELCVAEMEKEVEKVEVAKRDIKAMEDTCTLLRDQLVTVQRAILDNRKQFNLRKHYDAEVERWIDSVRTDVRNVEGILGSAREALEFRKGVDEALLQKLCDLENLKNEYKAAIRKQDEAVKAVEEQKQQQTSFDMSLMTLSSQVINDPTLPEEWSDVDEGLSLDSDESGSQKYFYGSRMNYGKRRNSHFSTLVSIPEKMATYVILPVLALSLIGALNVSSSNPASVPTASDACVSGSVRNSRLSRTYSEDGGWVGKIDEVFKVVEGVIEDVFKGKGDVVSEEEVIFAKPVSVSTVSVRGALPHCSYLLPFAICQAYPALTFDLLCLQFQKFGRISRLDVKRGASFNFAFVEFEDKRDAEDAIRDTDGMDLPDFGARLVVEWAKGGRRDDRNSNECFKCGREGHFARDCREGGRRRSPPRR
ncbi:hypothetical protein HK100_008272 [Physocladia obscura]|uniref:Uncharacterized protein n=1 Tax=Physocladia obscura TaxID=109957 RepID=A0AAD5T9A4_9FUNG|nr:hypothetical protein HK100_008272 [Physocladia obscura]